MKIFFESMPKHSSAPVEPLKMDHNPWSPGYLKQRTLSLTKHALQNGYVVVQVTHIYNHDYEPRHLALFIPC